MSLFIHRRDLRISDLPGFDYIRSQQQSSIHLLILDPKLLTEERIQSHSGKTFLKHVKQLDADYRNVHAHLNLAYGDPVEVIRHIHAAHPFQTIVFHRDDTPYARQRDQAIANWAETANIQLCMFDDLPLISFDRFQTFAGKTSPYQVFTPFYRRWHSFLEENHYPPGSDGLYGLNTIDLSSFEPLHSLITIPSGRIDWSQVETWKERPIERLQTFFANRLSGYDIDRDHYAIDATSGISVFLNSGAISVRTVYELAMQQPTAIRESWVRQLAWRDFYLYQSRLNRNFFNYEQQFDFNGLDDRYFESWAAGKTGIPVIDAAMRQLNETGEMPNRLRMVTAMFLSKNLLCPFTWGEQYFRMQLADYDHVLNRGGWLWSSSFGFDAAPYFRIMNPVSQSQRFDPNGNYIRRWLPERQNHSNKTIHLPDADAIVDLTASRAHAIQVYKQILGGKADQHE